MIEIIKNKKDIEEFFVTLKKRGQVNSGDFSNIVKGIVSDVEENGDEALEKYTKKFDNPDFKIEDIEIKKEQLKKAFDNLDENTKKVLLRAKERIYSYHMHQKRETWMYEDSIGAKLGMKVTPIEKVGVYVPGGKAAYPSSVLMNILPAKVAGCKTINMVTPAPKGIINNLVLAAAYVAEVDHVYQVGGAQAIAALAFGTKSIEKVDKIVGPGNIFVALAKREVYGLVGIDSIAGPSEICVVADETCNPKYVAADLLAQAEHDEIASSTLFITSEAKANEVKKELINYYNIAERKAILDKSLTNCSKIIVVDDIKSAIDYANRVAPEHLELAVNDPEKYVDLINNAGAIFMGHYSAESFGDYMSGPNHVLPTVATARFFSPLGVDDFVKKTSLQMLSKEAALSLVDDVDSFAMLEGLTMHALAARVRKE
ncbi:MAG: histidinol dehydrogenase [Acholeplasmatales bacterium]|nr:histidinol dehydrogenase [Acholeplasmatales bacterium]